MWQLGNGSNLVQILYLILWYVEQQSFYKRQFALSRTCAIISFDLHLLVIEAHPTDVTNYGYSAEEFPSSYLPLF